MSEFIEYHLMRAKKKQVLPKLADWITALEALKQAEEALKTCRWRHAVLEQDKQVYDDEKVEAALSTIAALSKAEGKEAISIVMNTLDQKLDA